ncbi:DUF2339 domain-containing protein [Rhizobiaceae bacterium n13]|uniref:DUF2339 domain-containing protein n=1 Tax=Ferirhizobium litorale TaxID=2927786 RepID=A0AAE3TZR2_9HYPH|nr:DUF2339 domain-containing protein [Fererhizobium litorale]MDI7861132.1 DUF2339 domain-containing protein [Fererhizobium litorale]MDI7921279.1 DUF2339 domain-containing protein [Fererhizobium litorale]
MLEILLLLVLVVGFASQRGYDRRLRKLEAELDTVKQALAGRIAADAPGAQVAASEDAPIPASLDAEQEAGRRTDAGNAAGAVSAAAADNGEETAAAPPPTKPAVAETLESRLGARWAVWVGGLALALGGIFMVRYSIESGLLSPAVRLMLAAVFGVALMGAGEFVRRTARPGRLGAFRNAMIPGILTAAGAVTLFGVTYAAHDIYSFVGPASAFAMMAAVALATLGLSLLYGQALAGLGLLGSMITPLLVTASEPNIAVLFGYLAIAWIATAIASRHQRWQIVPAIANIGLGLWAIGYLLAGSVLDLLPVMLALLVLIGGTVFIWPGRAWRPASPLEVAPTPKQAASTARRWLFGKPGAWDLLLTRPPLAITITLSVGLLLVALLLASTVRPATVDPAFCFAAIVAALAALGASRPYAAVPACFAATAAIAGTCLLAVASLSPDLLVISGPQVARASSTGYTREIAIGLGLGGIFILCGFSFLHRRGRDDRQFAMLWAALMALVPIAIVAISFLNYGDLNRDWIHGFYGIAIGAIFLAGAEWLSRREAGSAAFGPSDLLVGGSFAAFAFALHALAGSAATTVLVALLGFAYVLGSRFRAWPSLPWMMVAAILLVMARIAIEPTIVGAGNLGRTPVFNALLAGYGIPALLSVVSAYMLRRSVNARVLQVIEALASIMCLLTLAILVRHAMNGGVLTSGAPSLGEQSIYTLLVIGASATLMALDLKSPGPVFRYGSMVLGVISMLSVLSAHLVALNPFLTGENTGRYPFFNLLLIGYLLPAIGYAALAVYARDKRPPLYVTLLAVCSVILGFAWATLSVRRYWQGENLAEWKGFLAGETYSYSVVWLLIGVALLALGSRFNARSLRITSAALVLIAVVKVFLIDMANLEGFLRALSFIGLGIVLIGIGLFYQRILTGRSSTPATQGRNDGIDHPT